MKEGLLIGAGVIAAGVFVGFVAYKLVKKNPKALKSIRKKTSRVTDEAKKAFAEGFKGATAKVATA